MRCQHVLGEIAQLVQSERREQGQGDQPQDEDNVQASEYDSDLRRLPEESRTLIRDACEGEEAKIQEGAHASPTLLRHAMSFVKMLQNTLDWT